MSYFEQLLVFCMLINKNVLEQFLLIICKEHTQPRSTNIYSRNHPTFCLCVIREGRKMPNTEQLLYQTDKRCHRRCSIKKAVLKNLARFTGKPLCWKLFFNFIKKRLQDRYFAVAKFLRKTFLKRIFVRLRLN